MAPIHSTAISRTLPHSEPNNFWVNSRRVLLLAGAGATLYFLYRFFTRSDSPVLKQRSLVSLFPEVSKNATHYIPFYPAIGIFRIDKDLLITQAQLTLPPVLRNTIEEVFMECSYRGQPFCTQLMAPGPYLEVYIPEIPSKEKMTLRLSHKDYNLVEVDLQTHDDMSIYQIVLNGHEGKTQQHPYTLPKPVGQLYNRNGRDPEAPVLISILENMPLRFTNLTPSDSTEFICKIVNRSNDIHILFFQILGIHTHLAEDERYALPVVISPRTTKELPRDFFNKNWKLVYKCVNGTNPPADTTLQLLYVRDTISSPA